MPPERSPNRHRSEVGDKDRDKNRRHRLQDPHERSSNRVRSEVRDKEDKMPRERSPNRPKSEVGDKERDKYHRRRLQDALPLETPSAFDAKVEVNDASYVSNKKADELGEETKDSVAVPRSRSFFQHDERGTAVQDGRRSGRRMTSDRGWWKNSRDEEQATYKTGGSDVQEKEGKSLDRGGDSLAWRHDRFFEVDPPAKKRRQFREEKLLLEPEPAKNVVLEPSKAAHPVSSTAGLTERLEERARDRRPLERSEHDRAYTRERSFSNHRGRVEKTGFPSRERLSGGDGGGKYIGRDKFGGRQGGYRASGGGGRIDKWKHDLFDEADNSTIVKNDEDPVAKVEALLAL